MPNCPNCGNSMFPSKFGTSQFWCPACSERKKAMKEAIKEQDQGDIIIARLNTLEKIMMGEFQKLNERITNMGKFFAKLPDKEDNS